jgi:hypothetical protein
VQGKGIRNIFNEINNSRRLPKSWKRLLSRYRRPLRHQTWPDYHLSIAVIVKTLNTENKGRISKAVREECQMIYKGKPIRITADFSRETLKARKAWD